MLDLQQSWSKRHSADGFSSGFLQREQVKPGRRNKGVLDAFLLEILRRVWIQVFVGVGVPCVTAGGQQRGWGQRNPHHRGAARALAGFAV